MTNLIQSVAEEYVKKNLPEIQAGDTVRVHLKISEKDKTRIQVFEGLVIRRRGGNGLSGTFTVRKIAVDGIGVERTFLLHSPLISKIQVIKKGKVRRAQLYYIRRRQLKSLKLKERKEYKGIREWEEEIKSPSGEKTEAEKTTLSETSSPKEKAKLEGKEKGEGNDKP